MSRSYLGYFTNLNRFFSDTTPRSPQPEEEADVNKLYRAKQEVEAQYYKAKADKENADRERVAEEAQVFISMKGGETNLEVKKWLSLNYPNTTHSGLLPTAFAITSLSEMSSYSHERASSFRVYTGISCYYIRM